MPSRSPRCKCLSTAEADRILREQGLSLGQVHQRPSNACPGGGIVAQSPPRGKTVRPGTTIEVVISANGGGNAPGTRFGHTRSARPHAGRSAVVATARRPRYRANSKRKRAGTARHDHRAIPCSRIAGITRRPHQPHRRLGSQNSGSAHAQPCEGRRETSGVLVGARQGDRGKLVPTERHDHQAMAAAGRAGGGQRQGRRYRRQRPDGPRSAHAQPERRARAPA